MGWRSLRTMVRSRTPRAWAALTRPPRGRARARRRSTWSRARIAFTKGRPPPEGGSSGSAGRAPRAARGGGGGEEAVHLEPGEDRVHQGEAPDEARLERERGVHLTP